MKISNFKFQISNKYQFGIGNWKLEIRNSRPGFTLIEMLIVVTIIGILSSLLTANFITIRQRSRDAQRKSDLRQMQSALEIYRSDQGGYPQTGVSGPYRLNMTTACSTSQSLTSTDNTTYLQVIPCDPNNSAYNSGNYYYYSNGTTYTIAACLENQNDAQGTSTAPTNNNPSGCTTGRYYILYNP